MSKISQIFAFRLITILLLFNLDFLSPASADIRKLLESFRDASIENLILPNEQYVPMTAMRIKGARVAWINRDYFRQLGVELPESLPANIENEILKVFAWGIPNSHDLSQFVRGTSRKVYVDYYGGMARGVNIGSGRAASFGSSIPVQAKGLGPTLMVRETQGHSNGAMSLGEAIAEALFGELFYKNLPHGANRVLLVISTGHRSDYHTRSGAKQFDDAIVIREDPVRPAHFMIEEESKERFIKYRSKYLDALAKVLPKSRTYKLQNRENKIRFGVKEYVIRIAEQHANAFVLAKLYHGGTSESNIEISGKFLDYGTSSGSNSHAPLQTIEWQEPAGQVHFTIGLQVLNFVEELRSNFSLESVLEAPSYYQKLFERHYKKARRNSFLKLCGFSSTQIEILESRHPIIASRFSNKLEEFALRGARKFLSVEVPPERTTTYWVGDIIDSLFEQPRMLKKILRYENKLDIEKWTSDFDRLVETAHSGEKRDSRNLFLIKMRARAKRANKKLTELEKWKVRDDIGRLVKKFIGGGSSQPIVQYVEKLTLMGNRCDEELWSSN